MASIQKTAKGYRAQVFFKGQRDSKTFPTRREAVQWAAQRELSLKDGRPAGDRHSLRQALRKYADEVSPLKRGEHWEQVRLAAFERLALPIDKMMTEVSAADIAAFRDSRLKAVKGATVAREMGLLSSVFESARREWGWIQVNPCRDVRKPPAAHHRERTIAWWEVKRMLRQMGYVWSARRIVTTSQALAVCFLTALRTGMRAGELCGLTWDRYYGDYVKLLATKNGHPRDVPVSSKARRLIDKMRTWDETLVFGLQARSLDALFRKYRSRAGLEGFVWHDTRHTAATMMAKKLDVLTLCKVMGWHDTRFALVYFNPKASSIAAMLG